MILTLLKATQWRYVHNRMQAKRSLRKNSAIQPKPRMGRDYGLLLGIDNPATAWLCACVRYVRKLSFACIRLCIISCLRHFYCFLIEKRIISNSY